MTVLEMLLKVVSTVESLAGVALLVLMHTPKVLEALLPANIVSGEVLTTESTNIAMEVRPDRIRRVECRLR